MQTKGKQGETPSIGKYMWLSVLSGSMKPAFNPGDLIIDKKIDPKDLKVGDIVTYQWGSALSSHRIIEIIKDRTGEPAFKVKGDNNNSADETLVAGNAVIGKYNFKIPLLGYVLIKFKGPIGIILIWLLLAYVIGTEIYRSTKNPKQKETDKTVIQ
jgi:signal peptidase